MPDRKTGPPAHADAFNSFVNRACRRVMLPRHKVPDWSVCRSTPTTAVHKTQEPIRQRTNPPLLPQVNSLSGDQLLPYTKRCSPRQNETVGGLLVHASRCNQWNVWEHSLQRCDIAVATDVPAGNNFNEIGTCFPRRNHVGRSQGTRKNNRVLLYRELHDVEINSVACKEFRSRFQTETCRFHIQYTSSSHNHFRSVFHQMGDYLDRPGHRQSDLHDGDAATVDRFRGEHGVLGRRHSNSGNNANLLNASAHLVLVHEFGSFRDRPAVAGGGVSKRL